MDPNFEENFNNEERSEDNLSVFDINKINEELKDLNLEPEVKEIFNYLTDYHPYSEPLETKLKPFIPEYIPAVGEVEAFLKIPRPDEKEESLGL